MSIRRAMLIARGAASLVATLALLFGVPALLSAWAGWPLPTSAPSLATLQRAAESGVSDQFVIKTLAVIAWLAWAQLALAIVIELLAAARGRHAGRLPVLRGFQLTAARLVAGILMAVSTVQPARAFAATRPTPVVTEVSAAAAAPPARPFAPIPGDRGMPSPAADAHASTGTGMARTVTVQQHDTYWAIAERTLGDGFRWKEILDTNLGRTMPDGITITTGDEVLHSGWVLQLPDNAHTVAPPPLMQSSAGQLTTVTVEPGDNLWTISEHRLETDLGRAPLDAELDPYWRAVIDANQDRFIQPGNPNLILPGQELVLPSTGHDPPASRVHDAAPQLPPGNTASALPPNPASPGPAAPHPREDAPRADRADPKRGDRSGRSDVALAVAVGGLASIALAVGLKHALERRRRRPHGRATPQPSHVTREQEHLHHAVVAQADEERIDDLQGILGSLALSLADMPSDRRPRLVRHAADALEVLLDQPDPNPPPGWTSTDDGTVWTLHERLEPADDDDGPFSPAPLLVTIGQPEDNAQIYLDLEVNELLSLTGDPEVATNLARSIVTELVLSPIADTVRVIAVGGLLETRVDALEHLKVVDSWDDVAEDVAAWSSQSHEALIENDWPNPFVARACAPDHDALVPLAIIADHPPPVALAELLRINRPSTVAVVVAAQFDGATDTISCEPDALNFDGIGLACSPQELQADELAEMSLLLVSAENADEQQTAERLREGLEVADPPIGSEEEFGADASIEGETAAPLSNEPPEFDILVRLLGDVTVTGGKELKAKATSVAAYLALHRSVTSERLEEACWFGSDGTSHRKRLRDVMTECRNALGSQHFPANHNGAYVAGPRVGTDLELFEWHVRQAGDLEPTGAIEHYRTALDLVAGVPFSYPNAARASYGWVDFEHHATAWENRVACVARDCAELYLDAGEPAESIALLQRIAQAIPLNSTVVESLMRAHIAIGDRAAANRVYQQHANALEQAKLGEPDDAIEELLVAIPLAR